MDEARRGDLAAPTLRAGAGRRRALRPTHVRRRSRPVSDVPREILQPTVATATEAGRHGLRAGTGLRTDSGARPSPLTPTLRYVAIAGPLQPLLTLPATARPLR